jgi:uncharacterized protein (TIGR02391 family)
MRESRPQARGPVARYDTPSLESLGGRIRVPPKGRRPNDEPEEKVFTAVQEVDQAIAKLRRRLEDVQALDPQTVRYNDPRISSAAENFRDTVLSIYGFDSPEYRRFKTARIWHGSMRFNISQNELQTGFTDGRTHTIEAIENLIRRLEEAKADFGGDTAGRVRTAFEGLDLHPRIAGVCTDLYRDGHYRNAVADASVALVNLVKEKSRRHDLDGHGLMTTVFSKNQPILAFNDRRDRTEEDEQEGMMHLFLGAVLALRNPRVHTLFDDSPDLRWTPGVRGSRAPDGCEASTPRHASVEHSAQAG